MKRYAIMFGIALVAMAVVARSQTVAKLVYPAAKSA